MLKYEFRTIDDHTAKQLIELSQKWADEGCCWGIVANSADDLSEPMVVAQDGESIVAYAFGHYYVQERGTSYIDAGKCCFSLDELYVIPEYRGQGIGSRIYRMLEEHVRKKCSYITLTTPTKDFRSVLNLYLDELEMDFVSAFLIKNVEDPTCE